MIADIQSDVAAYTPLPRQVPWFKRLEDKLRRVYTVLTCTSGADVAPHLAAPRPTRHSSLTRDVQVSPSHHSTHRQDPRPRLTPVQTPRPLPTYEPGSSSSQQPDPSQPGPSQPGGSTWQPPPMYQLGMPPGYGFGMPPGYQFGMPPGYGMQPPPHIGWNPSSVPLTQLMGHLGGDDESTHVELEDDTMYQSPPPPVTQETQTQEEEPLRGRGMRDHRAPRRLSPSGPRQRRPQRYRAHRDD